ERAWLDAARDGISLPLDAAAVLGTMPNIPANRVNVQLDLGGPSWTVSAGEDSGLVALSLARAALLRGELDVAIVGAVDLSCQDTHVAALGGDDPPGDAAVVLVLRRLIDAQQSGEPVLGVIGSADGRVEAIDHAALRDRMGRCWAAGRLRDVVAAVITGRRGALPDARAWPGDVRLGVTLPDGETLALQPKPARPEFIAFAAADAAGRGDARPPRRLRR